MHPTIPTHLCLLRRHFPAPAAGLLLTFFLGGFLGENAAAQAGAVKSAMDVSQEAFFESYCLKCHNEEKQKGKFRVDDLPFSIDSLQTAERWQKILNALNSGDMPPEEEKQPPKNAKLEFLDQLSGAMVVARKALADQGGVALLRRLNRREYKNTLRELLGVSLDVSELPADGGSGNFDTNASSLFMSSDQFEQYHSLAKDALSEAFTRFLSPPKRFHKRLETEERLEAVTRSLQKRIDARRQYVRWTKAVENAAQLPENQGLVAELRRNKGAGELSRSWEKIPGAPSPVQFGFKDVTDAEHQGLQWWDLVPFHAFYVVQPENKTGAFLTFGDNSVNHSINLGVAGWPPGQYVVRIRVAATSEATPERRFLEFGKRVHGPYSLISTHHITGTMAEPQVLEIPLTLGSNMDERGFYLCEKGAVDDDAQGNRKYSAAKRRNGIGPEFALWVDWMELESVPVAERVLPPALACLQIPLGDDAVPAGEIRGALERFTRCVFRGAPASGAHLDRLLGIYEARVKAGDKHGAALRESLAVALASPRFLFLAEPSSDKTRRALAPFELATRLSYFLWGAPPDASLVERAGRGELTRPEVLASETERLLNDPRSADFVNAFSHQWLGLDRLNFFQFNGELYPGFDLSTKKAARQEIYETFGSLLRGNGRLTSLLKSDSVVVNALLANYYGIEGVQGDEFRRVELPPGSPRGGLLGTAAVMAMGSNGEHTSPVERGAWVLRKLLHEPPPPAPPNVPQLNRLEKKLLTTQERIRAHQEDPQCANCHRKIDPIGFGLENFDAAGLWRTEDRYTKPGLGEKRWTIDPAASLHNGPAFKDYFELRDIVAGRSEGFARGFTEALLEYGLGRPCGFSDDSLVQDILARARREDFALRSFIQALVASKPFQTK